MRLPNRVVSTSHQTSLVHDHLPTDDLVAYHAARAAGGVGAIFLEATAVDPTGLLTAHTLGGFLPAIVAGYDRLAGALHPHGTKLFVQLFHGGREQISAPPRAPAVAPSAVPSPRFKAEPRALTAAELRGLLDGYRAAARHCRDGGVDGIEVSMSHGYLIAQFFSPRSNRRADDHAAPLRFATEVLGAVREAAGPELAVGVRLSADELTPDGLDAGRCAEIAAALAATGLVDFASCVLGHSAYVTSSTWIVPPPPLPDDALEGPLARMRAAVDVPLIGTGGVHALDAAERLVAGGAADAVGMTRALIADPALVAKAAAGRAAEVLACVGCNQGCIGHYHAGVPIGCLVNPRTGRERTLPARAGGAAPLRVAVVGAGPAGVAAALEAAAHGDAVTLFERDRRHRRPAPPGRARTRPPRDVAALARERGRPPRRGAGRAAAASTRPGPRTWRRPTSSCSPPARAPIARRGRTATARPPCSTPGRRSPTPRPSPVRCWWPTGAVAGTASTPRRCWRRTGSRSRSRAPRRARARRCTSTSATSTSPAATSAGSPSATTRR